MADRMFLEHPGPEPPHPQTYCIPDPEDDNLEIFKTPLEIVSRAEWGAAEPYNLDLSSHPLPMAFVLLMYTRTERCCGNSYCAKVLRGIQKDHMEKKHLPDIQWNFMIGGNGQVYEGRGWLVSATKDAENMSWNHKSIDVAYVGSAEEDVTKDMKNSASRLVRLGLQLKMISEDFSVLDDMIYRPEDYPPFEGHERLYKRI